MEIIVHYSKTPEKQAEFDARVAKFHAEYVAQYIEKLKAQVTLSANITTTKKSPNRYPRISPSR